MYGLHKLTMGSYGLGGPGNDKIIGGDAVADTQYVVGEGGDDKVYGGDNHMDADLAQILYGDYGELFRGEAIDPAYGNFLTYYEYDADTPHLGGNDQIWGGSNAMYG